MRPEVFFHNGPESLDAQSYLESAFFELEEMTDYEQLFLYEMELFDDETVMTLAGMVAKIVERLGGDTSDFRLQFALRRRQDRIDSGHEFVMSDYYDEDKSFPLESWLDLTPDTEWYE